MFPSLFSPVLLFRSKQVCFLIFIQSLIKLLINFSSVASLLKAKPENSSKTQENDTKIMQQTSNREEKSSINVGTTEVTINEKALGLHRKITSHEKRNCKCRKRRAKVQY